MIEIRDVRECGRVIEPMTPESLRPIAAALHLHENADEPTVLTAIRELKIRAGHLN